MQVEPVRWMGIERLGVRLSLCLGSITAASGIFGVWHFTYIVLLESIMGFSLLYLFVESGFPSALSNFSDCSPWLSRTHLEACVAS